MRITLEEKPKIRLKIYNLKLNGSESPNSPILSVSQGPRLC